MRPTRDLEIRSNYKSKVRRVRQGLNIGMQRLTVLYFLNERPVFINPDVFRLYMRLKQMFASITIISMVGIL